MRVDITFDIPCAWSYMGFARFRRIADEARQAGAEIEVRFLPYQMGPDATVEGEPKSVVERRVFGPDFDHDGAYVELNQYGATEGIEFPGNAIWSNTFEAHRLVQVAANQGRGEQLLAALFRAHHTDGKNVASEAVLRELADEAGVSWSDERVTETRTALAEVRGSGVRTIPVFDFEGGPTIRGLPSERQLRDLLLPKKDA